MYVLAGTVIASLDRVLLVYEVVDRKSGFQTIKTLPALHYHSGGYLLY